MPPNGQNLPDVALHRDVRFGLFSEFQGSGANDRFGSKNETAYAVVYGGCHHGLSGNGGALS